MTGKMSNYLGYGPNFNALVGIAAMDGYEGETPLTAGENYDVHLKERDWFKERSHPVAGTYRYPGHPWRAEGFDTDSGRPLPSFGEDNEYVYKELLGYPDETSSTPR